MTSDPTRDLVTTLDGAINAAVNWNGDDTVRLNVETARAILAALSTTPAPAPDLTAEAREFADRAALLVRRSTEDSPVSLALVSIALSLTASEAPHE